LIEICAQYLEDSYVKKGAAFKGQKIQALSKEARTNQAAAIAPILRGLCSSETKMVGNFTDDDRVLEFINSNDLARLAPMGTSCPDHFLRTKIAPLVLAIPADAEIKNIAEIKKQIEPEFVAYRKMYAEYYEKCKRDNSPAIRDANPVVILYPGVGMFTFAKDKQTARVAAEFYINAINVMKGAEAISSYTSLPLQEAFNIEYWLLEEAKLQRMPKPKALKGKIALVTGSGGGIGKAIAHKFASEGACVILSDNNLERAIAHKFASEGACVILSDNNLERLQAAKDEFIKAYGKDAVASDVLDVTDANSIKKTMQTACLQFGGLDIIVNNAGLSISKTIEDHTEQDWDILYDVLVKGQFLVTQNAIDIMRKQSVGGDILNIVSKNALVSGPNNAGYGSAKAAQLHLSRLNAAELGKDKIRVNVINPDAVIAGSNIWSGGWAEGRAKAYGITIAELPAYYAGRTLLNEIILPEDIANACFAYVGGLLNKTTGNVINVDGGIAVSFVR